MDSLSGLKISTVQVSVCLKSSLVPVWYAISVCQVMFCQHRGLYYYIIEIEPYGNWVHKLALVTHDLTRTKPVLRTKVFLIMSFPLYLFCRLAPAESLSVEFKVSFSVREKRQQEQKTFISDVIAKVCYY